MQAKILLATTVRWPSAARLAAAFAKVGCVVHAFAPDGAPVTLSRFTRSHTRYNPFTPLASLRRSMAAVDPDLIVPCDDRALAFMLKLAGKDEAARVVIARSLGRLESYPQLISRSDFAAAAADMNIRAAQTLALTSEDDLLAALARFGFPAALKVDGSWGGDGVVLVHTVDEALAAFRGFSQPLPPWRGLARAVMRNDIHFAVAAFNAQKPLLSLQRFVPGTPANSAFACWQGRVLASLHIDAVQTQAGNGPASVVRRIDDVDMQQAVERVAERFCLSGLHGLDFMRDRDGRAHVIESNPRATQTAALVLEEGRDLVAALVSAAGQARTSDRPVVSTNPTVALFPTEWRRDPGSRWLVAAHHDVPWDDPAVLRSGLEPLRVRPFSPARLRKALTGPRHAFTSWKPSRPSF